MAAAAEIDAVGTIIDLDQYRERMARTHVTAHRAALPRPTAKRIGGSGELGLS
jgi:hypothetical protein